MQLSLGRNVVASVATAAMWIGSALISVPLILDAVGTAGYGVWTVALAIALFISVAEAGLGAGIIRFIAVARGGSASTDVARVAWTSLLLYVAAGVVLLGVVQLLAPSLVSAFDVPDGLREGAESMWRWVGLLILLALLANGLGSMQQGLERFGWYAASTAAGLAAQLVALVILLPDAGLAGVAQAADVQLATIMGLRAWSVRDVLLAQRPALLRRGETRELVGYSAQMQVSAVSTFLNSQSDKLVVGLIAPASTVGQLGIGSQVAESGRVVGGAAINPLVSRMSLVHGRGDERGLAELYARLLRLWILLIAGATVISLAALEPLVESWLGDGHEQAALLGGFLVAAFGINLSTGVPAAYLRAIGSPGLEARYSLMIIGLNLPLSVALGLAADATGVVAGTTCAYAGATVWFWRRARPLTPGTPPRALGSPVRIVGALAVCGAAAFGWGVAMNAVLPSGVALFPAAAGLGGALLAYLVATTGVRPTPENLRALFA